jgi:hypothetical protein
VVWCGVCVVCVWGGEGELAVVGRRTPCGCTPRRQGPPPPAHPPTRPPPRLTRYVPLATMPTRLLK